MQSTWVYSHHKTFTYHKYIKSASWPPAIPKGTTAVQCIAFWNSLVLFGDVNVYTELCVHVRTPLSTYSKTHIVIALYFFSYIEGIFIYHSGTPFSHSLRTNKVTIESNSVITTLSRFNVGLSGFLSTVPLLPIVQMHHFPMKNVHVWKCALFWRVSAE